MPEFCRRVLRVACGSILLAVSAAAAEVPAEEKITEAIQLESIEAKDAVVALRSIVGTSDVKVVDPHSLSIRDTAEKLEVAKRLIQYIDHPGGRGHSGTFSAGDETMVGTVALEHVSSSAAARMLMSRIAIARVASIEENEIVVFRDTAEKVKAAFALIEDFDVDAPQP